MYKNMKRIKGDQFPCGHLNIPYGNEFTVTTTKFGDFITYGEDKWVCIESSEFAYTNFAYNEDGRADDRFQIIQDSIKIMTDIVDKDTYFADFFKDFIAMKYKKHPEDKSSWIWDRLAIHKAPIDDLYHLLKELREMLSRNRIDMPYAYDKYGKPLPPSRWGK